MTSVVILDSAVQDLEDARDFYDRVDEDLGRRCVISLLADVDRLGWSRGVHPKVFGLHRALGSRFPFGIYYLVVPDEVRVVGILDLRRDPTWLRRELNRRER